jgi:hypothetical protein
VRPVDGCSGLSIEGGRFRGSSETTTPIPGFARVVSLEDDVDLEHALSGRLSTGISRGEFGGVQLLELVGGEPPDVYPAARWKDVPFDEPLIAGERRGCELDLLGSQRWVRYAPKVRLRLP